MKQLDGNRLRNEVYVSLIVSSVFLSLSKTVCHKKRIILLCLQSKLLEMKVSDIIF